MSRSRTEGRVLRPRAADAIRPCLAAAALRHLGPLTLLLAACGGDAVQDRSAWTARVDTLGDTIQVQTQAGSVWGAPAHLVPEVSIGSLEGPEETLLGSVEALAVTAGGSVLVLDSQVPSLREYAPDGTYVRSYGRPGSGPGELKGPDSGLALLSDGRVLVRDPGNARIQVFGADGSPTATWPLMGSFSTSAPLVADTADHVFTQTVLNLAEGVAQWKRGLVHYSPEGDSLDAFEPPIPPFEAEVVEASREGSVSRTGVPFAPTQQFAFTRYGDFVHGISSAYRFDVVHRDGSVLRITAPHEPVPVSAAERSAREAQVTRNLRRVDPAWSWNGPPIPDVKPAYRGFTPTAEGHLWVLLHGPGTDTGEPAWEAGPGEPDAPTAWTEPVRFDVFDRDGRYLGRVEAPDGFQTHPLPVIRGDSVWAVVTDALEVERVVRFRVERGVDPGAAGA